MNKVNGKKEDFAYLREDGSRIVIGYGLKEINDDLCEWYEVYFYKKQTSSLNLQMVKDAIIADIDARTEARILNGYSFTFDNSEEPTVIWLSRENQTNYSEAHRIGVVPVTFKINEDENKQAIYHTFVEFDELDRFYKGGVAYIRQCLIDGWQEKDGIDWSPYEELFPKSDNDEETIAMA